MRHQDLFSGIGGFALAARWAGIKTVGFCEIEEFPRKVLQKNFPNVPIHRDIHDLDGSDYAGIDIITGGYPCQPFSVAGNRGGTKDPRHLWPEMLRVITQARPAWVVCENVTGHVTLGLDKVLTDMAEQGYTGRPFIIPACAKNAQHRRERLWLVFNSDRTYAAGSKRPEREDICIEKREASEDVEKGDFWVGELEPREITPRAATYAESLRELDGIPDWVDRNKALGNSIVPQVAYEILRAIKSC